MGYRSGAHTFRLPSTGIVFDEWTNITGGILTKDERLFADALQSAGEMDVRRFSRMSRNKREAYIADVERRAASASTSGQMKKYRRLWGIYIALCVAAALSK